MHGEGGGVVAHVISSWKVSFSFATTEGRDPKRAHRTSKMCFKWIRYDTRSQKNCYELVSEVYRREQRHRQLKTYIQ